MSERSYCLVSSLVFTIVAIAHLARAVAGWPIQLGGWEAPLAASWAATLGAGALAIWGFRQAGRGEAG
jgi:hypothetical protein